MVPDKPQEPTHFERNILILLLFGYASLAVLFSIFVPIFEASDEVWHYPMVETIASTGKLPVQPLTPGESSGPWRQEGSQPPLYYAIGAALTSWIDTGDMERIRHLNPHVAAGELRSDSNNTNLVVHNPDAERFPWQGTVLAVHIVRFFSVIISTWAVYLTWNLVRELYPEKKFYALVAAGIHAFTPMYLFISSSVNNDNLIIPLCTLALIFMIRQIKYANPLHLKSSIYFYIKLGFVLALAMLTKASGMGLIPLIVAIIAWEVWQRILLKTGQLTLNSIFHETPYVLISLISVIIPVLTISGWWFYRNNTLYGDALGLNAFYAVLGMRGVPADMAQLWAERFAFATGYWGNFGGLNVLMPQWIYTVLNSIAILSFTGCCIAFTMWLTTSDSKPNKIIYGYSKIIVTKLWPFKWNRITAARALSWAWPAAVFVSWIRWATMTWSSQGRLIFSAIPMWSLALIIGLNTVTPSVKIALGSWRTSLKMIISRSFVLFLFMLCVLALSCWIHPAYTPPQIDESNPPTSLVRSFGDTLILRGYELHNDILRPGEQLILTLYWQASTTSPTDQSIFIHILGNGERIIAQRDTFPGHGLISTTWIQPGFAWSETHNIEISKLSFTPDTFTLGIGMYETDSGKRLQVFDDTETFQGEMILFEKGHLVRPDAEVPNQVNVQFGQGIILQGYNLEDVFVKRGQPVNLTLYWLAQSAISQDYTVSVQIIDSNWNKAGQNDSWPMNGSAPTSTWLPGQAFVEQRGVDIGPDISPGVYYLRIALYRINETDELEHLPVVWSQGQMPASSVTLTRIRVQ